MAEVLQSLVSRETEAAAPLDAAARAELRDAMARLERARPLVVRLADLVGGVVGLAGRAGIARIRMGTALRGRFAGVAEAALSRAYDLAILGLGTAEPAGAGASWRARRTRATVIASGAASGFAGLAGFVPDATLTTLFIMRDIARAALAEGEDLSREEARRACLEVFALRTEGTAGESELGYFSARLLLRGRPLTMLLTEAASRYGLVLGEKFSLQAAPFLGAVAGAALNAAFLDHYRRLAAAHFAIRRLERVHGREAVRACAASMRDQPFFF